MKNVEFIGMDWRVGDKVVLEDGNLYTVNSVGLASRSVGIYMNGRTEWFRCDSIIAVRHLGEDGNVGENAEIFDYRALCRKYKNQIHELKDKIEKLESKTFSGAIKNMLTNSSKILSDASGLHSSIDKFVAQIESVNNSLKEIKGKQG